MDHAAALVVLGLPGWHFLTTDDPTDRLILTVLAEKVAGYKENERKALAVEIVNALAKAIK